LRGDRHASNIAVRNLIPREDWSSILSVGRVDIESIPSSVILVGLSGALDLDASSKEMALGGFTNLSQRSVFDDNNKQKNGRL
jgi:hypothetical protein